VASDGQFHLTFAPLTSGFQPRLLAGRKVRFDGSLGSGRNFRYFVAQPVELNWFCPFGCKEQVNKRSMGSMPSPRVPMSLPSSTPDSAGQLRCGSANFLDARDEPVN
jgi:hypothetical protein